MSMMALGSFVFSVSTIPYRELERQRNWRHSKNSRVGVRDASQYVGPGDDKITINAMVAPNQLGDPAAIQELVEMAEAGDAYVLVDGLGYVWGAYVIDSLREGTSYHDQSGQPRRIEFSLSLDRVPDDQIAEQFDQTAAKKNAAPYGGSNYASTPPDAQDDD